MPAVAATTAPLESVLRSAPETPVIAKLVVVAFVVVALTPVKFWRVVEPVARIFVAVSSDVVRPPLNAIEVVVALPINGYAIVLVNVTAPVDADTAMPAPATNEVTPVFVITPVVEL